MRNKVKIEIPETQVKDVEPYMILYRNLIYNLDLNLCPKELYYKDESSISKIIDLTILSKRLGFLCFKHKSDLKVENLKAKYLFENTRKDSRWVKAKEFNTKDLEIIGENQLLFVLPGNSKIEFELSFSKGNMNEHARFSLIEGYRYNHDKEHSKHVIEYETLGKVIDKKEIEEHLNSLNVNFEEYLKKLND